MNQHNPWDPDHVNEVCGDSFVTGPYHSCILTPMDANLFIPACLPLLADTTLTQTLIEYEQTRLHVTKPDSPFPKQLHDKITEAILAVSDELVRRSRAVEQTVSASSVLSTRIQIPVPPTVQTSSII